MTQLDLFPGATLPFTVNMPASLFEAVKKRADAEAMDLEWTILLGLSIFLRLAEPEFCPHCGTGGLLQVPRRAPSSSEAP